MIPRLSLWTVAFVAVLVALWPAGGLSAPMPRRVQAASGCQFLSNPQAVAAFCDDLSQGPKLGGRSGDLDPTRWSVTRLVSQADSSALGPFSSTPVSACKAGITTTNADNDVLVCDAASGHQGQVETALSAQTYGLLSFRPRQPFDFAGRTGTVSFNVDALTAGSGSWWASLFITDQPTVGADNSSQVLGILPTNGLGLNFDDQCMTPGTQVRVDTVYTYANTRETSVPLQGTQCIATQRGVPNHIEVRLSQTAIEIWASDAGNTASFRQIGHAAINLTFTRGYVHFQTSLRAPIKYHFSPTYANNYWSALGFDGPVFSGETAYSVPDALTVDPNPVPDSGAVGALNIGYGLLNPSGMYTCCAGSQHTTIGPFTLPNVALSGVTSAMLTFAVRYTYVSPDGSFTPATVALRYRLDGGAWLDPSPQPNYAAELLCTGCPGAPNGGGGVLYASTVPLASLVAGTNTLEVAVPNGWNAYPPVLSNIELLTFGGVPIATATSTATATGTSTATATATLPPCVAPVRR